MTGSRSNEKATYFLAQILGWNSVFILILDEVVFQEIISNTFTQTALP